MPGSGRCRPSTPITRSNATIGVASTARMLAARQLAHVAERRVVQLRRIEHVADRDRAALARRQVRRRAGGSVVRAADAGRRPLGEDRHRLARLAEADEAALDVRRPRRLLDRDLEQLVEVAPRAERAARSARSGAPARARRRARRGARPLEREPGLGRERLHQRELVLVEEAAARRMAAKTTPITSSRARTGTKAQLLTCAISFSRLFTIGELSAS